MRRLGVLKVDPVEVILGDQPQDRLYECRAVLRGGNGGGEVDGTGPAANGKECHDVLCIVHVSQ